MRIALAALGLALGLAAPARALDPVYTGFFGNTALGGYDAVAYFSEGRPVKGAPEHAYTWRGATWRFASRENRETFEADPDAYAPRYGGYCAYAVAHGGTAPGDPRVWRIVDGRLYVNKNPSVGQLWERDISGHIARADANWPKLLGGR